MTVEVSSSVAGTIAPESHAPPARSARRHVLAALAALAALFALTARWEPPYFVDAYTNAMSARSFASDGSFSMPEATPLLDERYTGELVWIVDSPRGPVSQYPPGITLWAAPFYLLDTSTEHVTATFDNDGVDEPVDLDMPSLVPAAIAAVVAATLAMACFVWSLEGLLDERARLAALAVAALGTGVWSIAANMLWQHGPAMMLVSAGVLLASRDRFAAGGVAFAGALLVRPHTALVAACVGIVCGVRRRTARPVIEMAIPGAVGLGALLGYNWWLWGRLTISGGYGTYFTEQAADPTITTLSARVVEALFDPPVGMAVTSPFLLLGFWAMVRCRRAAPDWATGAALGGLLYLLVQFKVNRVSGGGGFFGYRYPLEGLMAMAPLMAITLRQWTRAHPARLRLFIVLAGASMSMHAIGAWTT